MALLSAAGFTGEAFRNLLTINTSIHSTYLSDAHILRELVVESEL
jgi:hypothetical protein